jgi:regulator of sirC expression with transglutaminase-like and TPR domain
MIALRQGDRATARGHLERYLRQRPNDEEARRALEQIAPRP